MTEDVSLRGDCSRCIGLCCVALAFDRGPKFGFDKPAGEPCAHLGTHNSCAIHARLERDGMAGCASYDCRGAGQLTTALFSGHSWRDGPATARQMFAVFARLREIALLHALVAGHRDLRARLMPPGGWTLEAVLMLNMGALRREVATSLAGRRRERLADQRRKSLW